MSSEDRRVLAVVGFAALLCGPLRAQTPSAPSLANAASFAVLGGTAVNNSGATVVTGNLGVNPGSTINGFPPGAVKLGDTFKNDALAKAAHSDASVAYDAIAGQTATCGPLGDKPAPNLVYCLSPSELPKVLTLDAGGKPDAFWVFKITGSLTTLPDSSVLVINGAQPGKVFWQVSNSATLGAGSAFVGNLLAHDNITLSSGASAFGRLLAITGTVTLNSNNVTLCSTCNAINLGPPTLPDGTTGTVYNQTLSASGGAAPPPGEAPYTFKVISGALPPGIGPLTSDGVLSGTPSESGTLQFTVAATDSQGCSGERKYTITIACPSLILSPPALMPATACIHYEQPITASCGSESYEYTSNDLPPGLRLNDPTLGILSGIVTTPDMYTFTVTAKDTVTHRAVSRLYTLVVNCNVTILPVRLPSATACAFYCETLTASCRAGSYTFSAPPGSLPIGLVLSTDGMLCGTPTIPGRITFTVTATDKLSDRLSCTNSRTYALEVGSGPIAISPPTLPGGIVGTLYPDQTITANCGAPGYICRITAGALPTGLTFANCTISGTPTTKGCFTFSVTVTDSNGNANSIRYTICVTSCPVVVLPPTLPNGSICAPYNQTIAASCAITPLTCSLSFGPLPVGLMLNNCAISGTPAAVGSFGFTIHVTDAGLNTADRPYTLLVTGGITLSPLTLPSGTLSLPYDETLIASGGATPYTFTVSSGTLPTGTTLNMATGQISGTPTVIGTFNFCITVTDANVPPCTATLCYTVTVAAAGPTLSGWGMLVLSILLAGAGFVTIRKGD